MIEHWQLNIAPCVCLGTNSALLPFQSLRAMRTLTIEYWNNANLCALIRFIEYTNINVYRITTHDNKKGVFVQIGSDCIEFYEDETRGYKYKGSCRYDYSINKISYIMEFTTMLNKLLEV